MFQLSGVHYSTGAFMIRIGFWGILHCKINKEPPKQYWQLLGPYISPDRTQCLIVEAKMLEHPYPHALKVK